MSMEDVNGRSDLLQLIKVLTRSVARHGINQDKPYTDEFNGRAVRFWSLALVKLSSDVSQEGLQ